MPLSAALLYFSQCQMTHFDSAATHQPRPLNLPGRERGELTIGFRERGEENGSFAFLGIGFGFIGVKSCLQVAVAVRKTHPLVFFF